MVLLLPLEAGLSCPAARNLLGFQHDAVVYTCLPLGKRCVVPLRTVLKALRGAARKCVRIRSFGQGAGRMTRLVALGLSAVHETDCPILFLFLLSESQSSCTG